MSAKTKTFLQQDHSSKRSSRDWSYQRDPRKVLAETSHNTVPPKPPIELESQNKTKLKSFQHHTETSITELNDGPSHSYPVEQAGDIQGDNATSTSNSPKDSNAQTPALPSANAFPSTPAVRLSIEELISGCDRPKPEPRQESPEEQIGWIPNSSNTLLTPNRRRKRARSSSPSCPTTSSQRNEASHFFTGDLAGTEDETPNADPAAELWQRFKASKKGDNTLKLPDISHLIFQASPRPLETPAKTAGFRRWASTGNDWPSSRRKRPRTGGRHGTMLYEDRTADNEVHAAGGKSKVATLVEKLQESLATQKLGQPKGRAASNMDEPSSSSPLPESGSRRHNSMPSGSPLRPRHQMQRRHYASAPGETSAPVSARAQSPSPNDGESDARYRQVAAFQDSINSAPLHLQSKAPLPAFKRPSWSRTSSHGLQHLQAPTSQSPISLVEEDTDEFGDDLDFSVEDLEELVSQAPPSHLEHRELYDIPEAKSDENEQQHSQADAAAYTIPPLEDPDLVAAFDDNDDDDEYGDDDIDEDSFALAEFTATQAAMKTGVGTPSSNLGSTRSR
ncbi:hypothetical protein K431DRAFT_306712 [Polychaeton citri CBS 116435]|uniref:Uncharacterized protein n=1 Tax=Polychaeton citri CBS 116435 TaxID=1314669 RepID=A0A9P4Q1K1_9PEZI|nr:hypothetical protein K431DRAFT_306712 [Polychaeton citri CBS 116435]